MLIRSQDRKKIINFAQLTGLGIDDYLKFKIVAYYPFQIGGDYSSTNIGEYSTEEKAINVLDMIQQEFEDCGINGVFQMPKDSEVQQ